MPPSYDRVPSKGGEHRGEVPEENKESTMNVRAPGPPDPDATDEDASEETSDEETSEESGEETSGSS